VPRSKPLPRDVKRAGGRLVRDGVRADPAGNRQARRHAAQLTRRAGRRGHVRTCRICGCTDLRACPGGCAWVADPQGGDLCSACVEQLGPVVDPAVDGDR
jgi:hypothetical protein